MKLLTNQQVCSSIQRVKVHSTVSSLQERVRVRVEPGFVARLQVPLARTSSDSTDSTLQGAQVLPVLSTQPGQENSFPPSSLHPASIPPLYRSVPPPSPLIPPPSLSLPPAPPWLQRPLRAAVGAAPPAPAASGSLRPPPPPPVARAAAGARCGTGRAAQSGGGGGAGERGGPAGRGPVPGAAGGRVRAHVKSGACPTDRTCESGWGARSAAGGAAGGDPHPDSWRRGPPARSERCRSRPAGRGGDARERRAFSQGHGRGGQRSERGRPGRAPSCRAPWCRSAGGGRGRGVPLWPRAEPAALGAGPARCWQQLLRGRLRFAAGTGGRGNSGVGRGPCRRRGCGLGTGALGPGPPAASPRSCPVEASSAAREGRRAAQGGQKPLGRVRCAAVGRGCCGNVTGKVLYSLVCKQQILLLCKTIE